MGESPSRRPDLDDVTLVARAQDGDVIAFERLVDRYQGPLFRLALRMLRDRGAAEDVVQDALVTVWRQVAGLSDPAAFPRWVYQITTRTTLNRLRARDRRPTDPADPELLDQDQHNRGHGADLRDPATLTEERATATALRAQIEQLPEDLRLCWTLYADHGRSYEEIADIVGVTHGTVRGRIARARQKLAEGMTPWR
ncbi:RNA polymerase sigma factor [Microlunatus soli]|uniref:RNA polymerase, sigma subunit, ECF family n=1 Tax=Microlunatus soli TaxID=630515 RepID=A0A1H1XE75_9ACTN|nr:sigma-70 family RNA polymerase sigma factor [Microlunatus soli]SDT07554.1 RNA polymerase, sigma subunit, ECF family [Microlunatus soli]